MANLVNLEAVSKSYGVKPLLDGVSLGVAAGQRIGVVGLNGGGKTTLLEVLSGLAEPDSGRVSHVGGLRMAVVTQRTELPDGSSVGEVVLERYGAEHEWAADARVRSIVDGLGITAIGLDTPTANLSGGERRRVSLAAALTGELDLVVLDEPTNHLDVEGVQWLADHLLTRRIAVVVVTHDRWFLDTVARTTKAVTRTGSSRAPSGRGWPRRPRRSGRTWRARSWRGCAAAHRRARPSRATASTRPKR
jgi:ATP-binding cassette subfamily F protein uup